MFLYMFFFICILSNFMYWMFCIFSIIFPLGYELASSNPPPDYWWWIFSKLDSYARCKLPIELKDAILKLIEKHCLNCGVSVNFDINLITDLSDEMSLTFIKLWKHVYSVSEMSQVLVLEVIRLFSDSIEKDEHFGSPVGGFDASPIIPEADLRGSGVNSNGRLFFLFFCFVFPLLFFYYM